MAYTLLNSPLDYVPYETPMYPLESTYSDSSAASSPHVSSPSPPLQDIDLSRLLEDFPFLQFPNSLEETNCAAMFDTDASMGIAPHELHAPICYDPATVGDDHPYVAEPVSGQDEVTSPQEQLPISQTAGLPNSVCPEVFPMKKDRERGSANLLRSAKDPERHHACTVCIRKFKRRADLARHLKRHQGVRPYECSSKSCPLAPLNRFFFRADARQRHWKAHPQCEVDFYMTEAGVEWAQKNKNRSQKSRGTSRRSIPTSRGSSLDSPKDYDDDDDDADYHD
ncbi:hypothetical protein FRC14_002692 [Serendipita sp. 396]|nr:hypothetical protein FRC14_002692 [Serendipita sp. 396]KAG8868224.1 hypothetical protein FRC20_003923 [Serendipita sp. 405]